MNVPILRMNGALAMLQAATTTVTHFDNGGNLVDPAQGGVR